MIQDPEHIPAPYPGAQNAAHSHRGADPVLSPSTPELTSSSFLSPSTDSDQSSYFSLASPDDLPGLRDGSKKKPIVFLDSPDSSDSPTRIEFFTVHRNLAHTQPGPTPPNSPQRLADDNTNAPSRRRRKPRPIVSNLINNIPFATFFALKEYTDSNPSSFPYQASPTRSVLGFSLGRKNSNGAFLSNKFNRNRAVGGPKNGGQIRLGAKGAAGVTKEDEKDLRSTEFPLPPSVIQDSPLSSTAAAESLPSAILPSAFLIPSPNDIFLSPILGTESATLRSGWKSTWSLAAEDEDVPQDGGVGNMDAGPTSPIAPILSRPRFLRRHATMAHRRWTIGADEGSSEDVVSPFSPGDLTETIDPAAREDNPESLRPSLPSLSDPVLASTWQNARRALLTCRELVRTERHYLSSLHALLTNGTTTPPSTLMLSYVPALVQASTEFLARIEANPSAQGVAEAFIAGEEVLESAFVGWCEVVGEFFSDAKDGSKKAAEGGSGIRHDGSAEESNLKRKISLWRKNALTLSVSVQISPSEAERGTTKVVRGMPAVRDLAILPTQRVTRYALLYKDLLSHTPATSPCRAAVELAVQAALNIAQKCNGAQTNTAFLRERP